MKLAVSILMCFIYGFVLAWGFVMALGYPLAKSVPPLHGASRKGVAPKRGSHSLLLQSMGLRFWGYIFRFYFPPPPFLHIKEKEGEPTHVSSNAVSRDLVE